MSKEILEQFAAVARQIEEQLKFYREIGVVDIGGAARSRKKTAVADSAIEQARDVLPPPAPLTKTAPPPAETSSQKEYAMPGKKEQVEQVGLFGDVAPSTAEGVTLPALQSQDASLEAIREDVGECTRCKLHERRTNIVFGEGNPQARIVFVGEGPGADEDLTGRPFVGRAGQLLDKIIAAIGLRREDVYIANIVMCRPPGNRAPERDEVATCEPFLFRKLALIRPQVIVALGSPAFQCLLKTRETITRSRGEWREWNGIKVMPTFHPAYLLRVPAKKREAWEDMKKVRDYLNSLPD
ncbi:MAG: uracil-DNA glycosylase [Blastocatellia bacterium]|nr:uracil-DNA glycosylase [Blastocatellia bacterium]